MKPTISLKFLLAMLLAVVFLLLGLALFLANPTSTRDFLQRQLASHAQDSASALALQLSDALTQPTLSAAASKVDALFDTVTTCASPSFGPTAPNCMNAHSPPWKQAYSNVSLVFTALMGGIFLVPGLAERNGTALLVMSPFFLLSLLGVAFLGAYVLLVGYVFGDARRRKMNSVLWTLLVIFIPSAVGFILYFILRDPVPAPCPACGALARKGHAFCAGCGAAVRPACLQCRQPVEPGWRNCARCGAALTEARPPPPPSS